MTLSRRISMCSPVPSHRCMSISTATSIRTINPHKNLCKRHILAAPLDTLALPASPRTHRKLALDEHRLVASRSLKEAHRADLDVWAALLAAPEARY